jgi:RNA polymerase sigma-70 factor (ECF subfamily)
MPDPAGRVYFQVLVVRCQLGDRDAFAELVAGCQPRLRAFLHKMLPEPHAVDDVMQDVWMDVFRDLPKLLDASAFLPWLYRIAHNRCFRMLRRRREPPAQIDDLQVAQPTEDEDEFTAEDAAAVHAALGKLSAEHREVLLLRFLEDMSYDDIAGVVMCPVGTVRSRIYNAKSSLRRILETARLP